MIPRPAGVGSYRALELDERPLEHRMRIDEIGAIHRDAGRDDLVMERRNLDRNVVVRHGPHAVENMLLRRQRAGGVARWRRAGELVDELVRTGRTERAHRRARENLPPRELHAAGWTRTSERRMRVTFRFTCLNVYGGATCSLTT